MAGLWAVADLDVRRLAAASTDAACEVVDLDYGDGRGIAIQVERGAVDELRLARVRDASGHEYAEPDTKPQGLEHVETMPDATGSVKPAPGLR